MSLWYVRDRLVIILASIPMAPIFRVFSHSATFSSGRYARTTVLVTIVSIVVNNVIIKLTIVVNMNRTLLTIAESYITHMERPGQGVRRGHEFERTFNTSLLELADPFAKEMSTTYTPLSKISTDWDKVLT